MAYPASIWAILKNAYESGKYPSCEAVALDCPKLLKSCKKYPSLSLIQKKAVSDNWDKSKFAPLIEQSIREKKIAAAAAIGFKPIEQNIKTLAEMHRAEKPVVIPSNATDKEGNKEPGFADVIPDWQARANAVKLTAEMFGLKEPERVELPPDGVVIQTVIIDMPRKKPEGAGLE